MGLIDFDLLYKKYVLDWAKKNTDKLKGELSPEHFIEEIYTSWIETPQKALDGKTPKEYYLSFEAKDLVNELKNYTESDISVPSVLLDAISSTHATEKFLIEFLHTQRNNPELLTTAINLINEIDSHSEDFYNLLCDIMLSSEYDEGIREIATEVIIENPLKVKDRLIKTLSGNVSTLDESAQKYLADVLVNIPDEEKIFEFLCKMFKSGLNDTLYSAYLGKYNDERALGLLYERLSSPINYMEYLEIRNSIERLGGEVQKSFDFSDDPYYKALKNVK